MALAVVVIVLSGLSNFVNAQTSSYRTTFFNKVSKCGLSWNVNKAFSLYKEVNIDPAFIHYDYAVYDKASGVEVRYIVVDLSSTRPKEDTKDKTTYMANQKGIYKSIISATYSRLTEGPPLEKYKEYPTESAKKDYNADGGGVCILSPNSTLGSKYKNIIR